MFYKLAFLNIIKHKKRSLLIIFCVFLSVFILTFISGFMNGMKSNYFHEIIGSSGHIQIHADGWKEQLNPLSLDFLINNPDSLMQELQNKEGIVAAEKFIYFGGLAIKDERNIELMCTAIQNDSDYYRKVQESLDPEKRNLYRGEVLLSTYIGRLLDVEEGETIMLLCQDSMESPIYRELYVKALFKSGKQEIDENQLFISLEEAEDLIYLPEQAIEIRLQLENPETAAAMIQEISPILSENGLYGETWEEINGSMVIFIKMVDVIILIMDILFIIVVTSVLTNAILMTVLARSKEHGTLRAIGLKKRQLFVMIVTEGVVLGIIGSLAGLALGIPLVSYFSRAGLNIGDLGALFGTSSTYYFSQSLYSVVTSFFSGVLIAAGGSFFAASISAKKGIIESLTTL